MPRSAPPEKNGKAWGWERQCTIDRSSGSRQESSGVQSHRHGDSVRDGRFRRAARTADTWALPRRALNPVRETMRPGRCTRRHEHRRRDRATRHRRECCPPGARAGRAQKRNWRAFCCNRPSMQAPTLIAVLRGPDHLIEPRQPTQPAKSGHRKPRCCSTVFMIPCPAGIFATTGFDRRSTRSSG